MKFRRLLFIFLCCCVLTAQHYENTSNMAILLGALELSPPSMRTAIYNYLKARFDILVLGRIRPGIDFEPPAPGPITKATTYTDIAVSETSKLYEMQDFAEAEGYDFENLMIHTSHDLQFANSTYIPANENVFDRWDFDINGIMQHGIMTDVGGTFTDVTFQPSSSFTGSVSIADTLYLGYMLPFDKITFTITTARVGGSVAYEYWNGSSWTTITTTGDTTSGLTISGSISFTPPSNWARNSVNSSRIKYFVRIRVISETTAPVFSAVRSDDWTTVVSGPYNSRGWDASDPNIINPGTPLEYNPTPPANASAKFKYQSRVPTNFLNGFVYLNQSTQEGGVRTAGKYLVYDVEYQVNLIPGVFSGTFFDDTTRLPENVGAIVSPSDPYQYYDVTQTPTPAEGMYNDQALMYAQAETDLHTLYGVAWYVGANNPLPEYPEDTYGDYANVEAFTIISTDKFYCNFGVTNAAPNWCPYDRALTVNNANETKYYFQSWDRWTFAKAFAPRTLDGGDNTIYTSWHFVEQGNRTPIMLLAMHLIGRNDNTGYAYYGGAVGLNNYYQTDGVYVRKNTTTLSASVTSDTAYNTAKTFTLASKAGCDGAGRYMWLGDTTSGELVQGQYGRVLWGTSLVSALADKTWDVSTSETRVYGGVFSGYPNVIYYYYDSQFTQLDMTFVTPATGPPADVTVWQYWDGDSWETLSVTDGTNDFHQNGSVTWTAPGDWASATSPDYSVANAAGTFNYVGYGIRVITYNQPGVGYMTSPQWVKMDSMAGPNSSTPQFDTTFVYNNYSSGAVASCVAMDHLSQRAQPTSAETVQWVRWFPAMATISQLGTPTASREQPWLTGGAPDNISGIANCSPPSGDVCSDVWRRDYTNGIVLVRPYIRGYATVQIIEDEIDTYSVPISLGGTYYPLKSDGTTGAGITSIQLRGGEGAILMLNPVTTSGNTFNSSISGGFTIR